MDRPTNTSANARGKLTLDFNAPASYAKKAKIKTCILESPDLKMLKLGSPELERLIMQEHNGMVTPTPSAALPYLLKLRHDESGANSNAAPEHEQYAQGFIDALKQLQQNKERDDSSDSKDKSESATETVTEPIDMADQERIKLERKRQRNRIAASKCRRKKLDRIATLEDRVRGLKGENCELSSVVTKLRQQVSSLKQQIMDHANYGCELQTVR